MGVLLSRQSIEKFADTSLFFGTDCGTPSQLLITIIGASPSSLNYGFIYDNTF